MFFNVAWPEVNFLVIQAPSTVSNLAGTQYQRPSWAILTPGVNKQVRVHLNVDQRIS